MVVYQQCVVEDVGEILHRSVPIPQLFTIVFHIVEATSDAENVWNADDHECDDPDGKEESQPSTEEGGGDILAQLNVIPRLNQGEWFRSEDVA